MENSSSNDTTKYHYIWMALFSILGILVTVFLLHDRNPPIPVLLLSTISTGIIGGIVGVMIANFMVEQKVKRVKR